MLDFPGVKPGRDWSREDKKRFAEKALPSPWRSHLFARRDDKSYADMIWDDIKPEGGRVAKRFVEWPSPTFSTRRCVPGCPE